MKVGFVLVALVGVIGFVMCSQSPDAVSKSEARNEGVVQRKSVTARAPIAFVPWDVAGEISRMETVPQAESTAQSAAPKSDELPKGVDPVQLRATIARMSKMYAGLNEAAEIRTIGKPEASYAAVRE